MKYDKVTSLNTEYNDINLKSLPGIILKSFCIIHKTAWPLFLDSDEYCYLGYLGSVDIVTNTSFILFCVNPC